MLSFLITHSCYCLFYPVKKQICAGAVVLTDCVYWLIIFPFLTIKDYNLNFVSSRYFVLRSVCLSQIIFKDMLDSSHDFRLPLSYKWVIGNHASKKYWT